MRYVEGPPHAETQIESPLARQLQRILCLAGGLRRQNSRSRIGRLIAKALAVFRTSAIGFGSFWSLRASVVSGGDFGGPVSTSKNPVHGGQGSAVGALACIVAGRF